MLYASIETLFGLGLFINSLLFVLQIIKLYKTKNAESLSLPTFAGFCLIQIFTILHGLLHDDYILIVGNFLSLIACGTVTFQILIYQNKTIQIAE